MNRKLNIFVIAMSLALALGALSASAAQAVSSLDIGATPAIITIEELTPRKFVIGKPGEQVTVKCSVADEEATWTEANITEQTIIPSYSGCTLAGVDATIDVNSCRYTLTNTTTALLWKFDITACGAKGKIEITSAACEIEIPEQTGLSSITYANEGTGESADVKETFAITGLKTIGTSGCPKGVMGTQTTSEISGTGTMRAFRDVNGVEGAQTSVKAT